MKKFNFMYPAIFIRDEDDGSYQVIFPDLDIYTDGKNLSEAYIYAKALLKTYFTYALKYEIEYNLPSKLEPLVNVSKPTEIVMLVDTYVEADA